MSDWPNIWHRKEYSKYSLSFKPGQTEKEEKVPFREQRRSLVIVPLILICPLFELQHINCRLQQYGSLLYVLGGMLSFMFLQLKQERERKRPISPRKLGTDRLYLCRIASSCQTVIQLETNKRQQQKNNKKERSGQILSAK